MGYGMKTIGLLLLLACVAAVSSASEYASTVVYSSGLNSWGLYDTPGAVLGEPTSWIYDDDRTYWGETFACSMVYGAWNVTPQDEPVITTIGSNVVLIVGFDHPVLDDPANPYGMDFIVFGNAFFSRTVAPGGDPNLAADADMDFVVLDGSGSVSSEKVKVEVAAALNPSNPNDPAYWFTFAYLPADGMYPTNRFAWDSVTNQWGQPLDPLKPINPTLKNTHFANLTVSQAIALYDGSAGGTGYDLQWLESEDYQQLPIDPQTGKRWIKYIRFTAMGYPYGEIDAVSDVAAAAVPSFPRGDANYDYRVDLQDLLILSQNWLMCTWNCQ
jgi:hypothetical protein